MFHNMVLRLKLLVEVYILIYLFVFIIIVNYYYSEAGGSIFLMFILIIIFFAVAPSGEMEKKACVLNILNLLRVNNIFYCFIVCADMGIGGRKQFMDLKYSKIHITTTCYGK